MNAQEIDVRAIAPWDRHAAIFSAFDALELGQSLVLVNDHDPVPLQRQFATLYPGGFDWDYAEKGPALFKVVITRANTAARDLGTCCGTCGG